MTATRAELTEALTDARMARRNAEAAEAAALAAIAADDARREAIAHAGIVYARTRNGEDGDGKHATREACDVLHKVQSAHMGGRALTLSPTEATVLWADITRRTARGFGLD